MTSFIAAGWRRYAFAFIIAQTTTVAAQGTADDSAPQAGVVDEVVVTGRAQTYYLAEDTGFATKTATSFLDIPQSVQVLTRQLIDDQAARETIDLYRSISGVTQFSYSGVTFRGFRQDQVRYDGVAGDPYSGFAIPQLFNVERVDVLKGPTGMLYGGGEPGGLINYVTKKPKFERDGSWALFAGDDSRYGGSIEATGPLGVTERVAYRLGLFYEDRDIFRNNAGTENALFSSGLAFRTPAEGLLTLQYDYVDQDLTAHRLRGVPVTDAGDFITDIGFNTNESSDFQRVEAHVAQAILELPLGERLTSRSTLRYLTNERTQNYHEPRGLLADGRTMTREFRDQVRENDELSLTVDLVGTVDWGGFGHKILFGGDVFAADSETVSRIARGEAEGVPNIDILTPVYGVSDPASFTFRPASVGDTEFRRFGLYLQDQIELSEAWLLLLGVRFDDFEDTNDLSGFDASDSALSPRAGLIFQPDDGTTLYASYSEGFNPQRVSDQEGDEEGALDPEESAQIELGFKKRWLGGRLQTAVAVYQIVKENVRVGNPNDTGIGDGIPALLQIGEVESTGAEIDVVGDITNRWTLTASYAYNDVEITGGNPNAIRNSIGDAFANAPLNTFGLWTRYDFPSISSALALGVDYVDERISLGGQRVQSYTIYDASWRSSFAGYELQINVRNLTDKEYAASGFIERTGHFPGEPRTVLVQLSRDF